MNYNILNLTFAPFYKLTVSGVYVYYAYIMLIVRAHEWQRNILFTTEFLSNLTISELYL